MTLESSTALLGPRFASALGYVATLHATQLRKGTQTPYVSHLLAVASLAIEYGANEDEAIAALLHDSIEDQGGAEVRRRITALFGQAVADIVEGCTDTDVMPKPPWRERKERYIAHVSDTSPSIRLVSMCDKLHNARSLIMDLRGKRADLWSRFSAGRDETCWYYRQLVTVFRSTLAKDPPSSLRMNELLEELDHTVEILERESAQ
ncbi:MAG: HD domain-containing protein [Myxococcota bacterium]|nr:HD domain-containing protein [Deltaproteobacteria bacterium]MDQ3337750.1 HD domain-containing protein [Myxococcota bacterium]